MYNSRSAITSRLVSLSENHRTRLQLLCLGARKIMNGKVCVITGGAGGIGLCVVKNLLTDPAVKFVALFDLDNSNTRAAFDALLLHEEDRENNSRLGFYPCNVSDTVRFTENLDRVIESHGCVDVLINNAGVGSEIDPGLMIDVNYKAVVLGSLALIDRVGRHRGGRGGVVVNVSSIVGLFNLDAPVYCSTKHAVVSFTRTMREQFEITGVRVVAVCPGLTDTPMVSAGNAKGLDYIDYSRIKEWPIQSAENVAAAVIEIIKLGKSGDVWVSEENQPPYAVAEVKNYKSLKIPIDR